MPDGAPTLAQLGERALRRTICAATVAAGIVISDYVPALGALLCVPMDFR